MRYNQKEHEKFKEHKFCPAYVLVLLGFEHEKKCFLNNTMKFYSDDIFIDN